MTDHKDHAALRREGEKHHAQRVKKFAAGGDVAQDKALIRKAMDEHDAQQHHGVKTKLSLAKGGDVDGEMGKTRLDRPSRRAYAAGGGVKKGKASGNHVNVIIAPPAGGGAPQMAGMHPPMAPPMGGPAMPPPRPPMAGPPVGAGVPGPGMPPGGPPPGMMMGRAAGGRTAGGKSGIGRLEKKAEFGKEKLGENMKDTSEFENKSESKPAKVEPKKNKENVTTKKSDSKLGAGSNLGENMKKSEDLEGKKPGSAK